MARSSEGIWVYDALKSSYFVHRSAIAIVCSDMLGSAKVNGMAGHTVHFGDRFSYVESTHSSLKSGSKSLYYPVSPPRNHEYNPKRPASYNLAALPLQQHDKYLETIIALDNSTSQAQQARITHSTGVSRLPLCAASPLFYHPMFFPLDPFHLFYENCAAFIWDIWTTGSKVDELIHLPAESAKTLGEQIPLAMLTLPPAFCGPVRDPHLKCQSQYKVYEWMALVHWYIIPIGMELSMDPMVLSNFAQFVLAVETAMTIQGHSEDNLKDLEGIIRNFLLGFETLYVDNNPENIQCCRLCIFQLIHVLLHIKWHGSIRNCSQGCCERMLGEVEHKIRSRKAPFANLANIITEKELIRILHLYYPSLSPKPPAQDSPIANETGTGNSFESRFMKKLPVLKSEAVVFGHHIELLSKALQVPPDSLSSENVQRWGKAKLLNGRVLQSQLASNSITCSPPSCTYRWFEVRNPRFEFI